MKKEIRRKKNESMAKERKAIERCCRYVYEQDICYTLFFGLAMSS
jgi:hypothetical protein